MNECIGGLCLDMSRSVCLTTATQVQTPQPAPWGEAVGPKHGLSYSRSRCGLVHVELCASIFALIDLLARAILFGFLEDGQLVFNRRSVLAHYSSRCHTPNGRSCVRGTADGVQVARWFPPGSCTKLLAPGSTWHRVAGMSHKPLGAALLQAARICCQTCSHRLAHQAESRHRRVWNHTTLPRATCPASSVHSLPCTALSLCELLSPHTACSCFGG